MIAYKKNAVVQPGGKLMLSELPFQPGQQVEVTLSIVGEQSAKLEKFKQLFRETQQLPAAKAISDKEIEEEIEAYRARR